MVRTRSAPARGTTNWRTLGAVVAGTGLIGLPLIGVWAPAASAEEVPRAITKVDLVQDQADRYASTTLALDWAVPDSAKVGDTFTLGLPPELKAVDGTSFDLRTGPNGGDLVAKAVVKGGVVTFTLTDYVDSHLDVSGSAWFTVAFTNAVKPGDRPDLVFTTTGQVFHDTVKVTGVVAGDYSTSATKWQAWSDPDGAGPLTEKDGILWAVNGPRITKDTAGGTFTFVDTPGPGQAIQCDAIDMFWGTRNTGGVDQGGFYGSDRYTKTCSPDSVTITMKTYSSDIGRIPFMLGRSRVTADLAQYRNAGVVRVERGGTYQVGDTIEASAGGVGAGRTPTTVPTGNATPTTAPPTPGSSSTPTGSSTPAPTSTGGGVPIITTKPTASTTTTTNPTNPAGSTPVPVPSDVTGDPTPTVNPTWTGGSTPTGGYPPVGGSTPAPGVDRIDTGVPAATQADPWLVGGGLALVGASGAGLVLAGRRRGDVAGDDAS